MKKWRKSRGLFLSSVATGAMLNPLNSSMIALAIPNIQRDFDLSYLTVSWLISSFYLASAVTQPIAGKLGDLIGRRKMFLGGLILVAVSALGAPLAPAFAILMLMRLFQAVGSGAIYPAGIGMVRDHIHERQGAALGFIALMMSTMAALGPTIGGVLISWGDWPLSFISFFSGLYCRKEMKKEIKSTRIDSKNGSIGLFLRLGLLVFFCFYYPLKQRWVCGGDDWCYFLIIVWQARIENKNSLY